MATPVLVVIALIVGFGVGLIWKIPQPKLTTDPNQRMQLWKAVTLLAYLLTATSLTGYAVYALWSPEPVGGDRAEEPACVGAGNPFLASLNPETLSVGSSVNEVFLRGCGFTSSIKVKFNGADRPSTWAGRQSHSGCPQPSGHLQRGNIDCLHLPGPHRIRFYLLARGAGHLFVAILPGRTLDDHSRSAVSVISALYRSVRLECLCA